MSDDNDFDAITDDHRRRQAQLGETLETLREDCRGLDAGIEQCMATLARSGSSAVAHCPDCERPYWSDGAHDCPTPGGEPPDSPPAGRVMTPTEARAAGAPVARRIGPSLAALIMLGCSYGDPYPCDVTRCATDAICVEGKGCVTTARTADGLLHSFPGERSRCGRARLAEATPDDDHDRGRCPHCWRAP